MSIEFELPTEEVAQKQEKFFADEFLDLINESNIPQELKDHFTDIFKILYHGLDNKFPQKQLLSITNELNLAKRNYCQQHNLNEIIEANELINLISQKLYEKIVK